MQETKTGSDKDPSECKTAKTIADDINAELFLEYKKDLLAEDRMLIAQFCVVKAIWHFKLFLCPLSESLVKLEILLTMGHWPFRWHKLAWTID